MPKVSHMVLPVTDLHRSCNWHIGELGFVMEREQQGVVGIRDGAGLTIFLWEGTDTLTGRKITLTIEVDDVDGLFQRLQSKGVKFSSPPKMQFWGYGAEVLDPDGYMNHLWDSATMSKATQKKTPE